MCGRYSFAQLSLEVEKRFKIQVDGNTYIARYNCAPSQKLGLITNLNPKELSYYHWGLIPSWSKQTPSVSNLINARAETLLEKPAFQSAVKRKRCLIPADGFYEWKRNSSLKTPYYIRLKTCEMFAFAGIWEEWKDEKGNKKNTFAIITTKANKIMQNIHNRMPVILSPQLENEWLLNPNTQDAIKTLQPFDSQKLEAFEVSSKVNDVNTDASNLTDPFRGAVQTNLFDL